MLDLDFSKIRIHDGSKDNGFEELVCQIAHLSPPPNSDYFVRKDGAGGDAGVECYWKLTDGSEHAWQAKYFLDSLDNSQWTQISDSVETALEKHPKLTKYYVCLPRDWNDSRKRGSGGKTVKSAWDKWLEHVEKWEAIARKKGMNVEFTYWCKHELSQMLQTDNPLFSGKLLYWFNEPFLHQDLFKRIAKSAEDSLGERYTPEFHVDLPIAKQFDALALTPEWMRELEEKKKLSDKLAYELTTDFFTKTDLFNSQEDFIKLKEKVITLDALFSTSLRKDPSLPNFLDLLYMTQEAEALVTKCSMSLYDLMSAEDQEEKLKNIYEDLYKKLIQRIQRYLFDLKQFFRGDLVDASSTKAALLFGDAGIGKSHLLCDIALKRLDRNLPTLFLLGQHYPGGNPLNFLAESLGLKNYPNQQVLGALNAAGEAKNTRTLIIIDAINEGNNRDDWYYNFSSLLTEVSLYPNVSIVCSCRSTYKEYILPELPEDRITKMYHFGFKGYEHRAASIYLSKQGISKPSAPITSPEFSNPLFLKTCCKALKMKGLTSFPKGISGQSGIFQFYLDSIERIIIRTKKYLPNEKIIYKVIDEFVKSLFPDYLNGMPIDSARAVIDSKDPKPAIGETLTNLLVDEGIFSFDIIPDPEGKSRGKEVIRFTYERFCDYFLAQSIVNDYINSKDISSSFSEDGFIGKILNDKNIYRYAGIIEALGICIPETFDREFIDFIPRDSNNYDWLFRTSFTEVVLLRSPSSINERSLELLNQIPTSDYYNKKLDILLSLSTEPDHPWNADFLDKNLFDKTLPKRDALWSTYLAVSDWEEDYEQGESIVRTLIDWSLKVNVKSVEIDRLRLTAITLLWMTTTSNRKVRDQATKSLARILSHSPTLITDLINKYNTCNDPYLVERLYAAVYGAICNTYNNDMIKEVAYCVFENVFKDGMPYPNILIRDYSRGIIEFAHAKGFLTEEIRESVIRPPYKSDWPIENPSMQEIEKLAGDKYSSIKTSVMGYTGDFGKYTMSCVHNWSPTPLSEEKPESSYDLHLKFAEMLPENLKHRYITEINKKTENQSTGLNFEGLLKRLQDTEKILEDEIHSENEQKIDEWEKTTNELEAVLDDKQRETFRWINGLGYNNRPATFSRKWAQRWVCKRAYELGWDSNLFEDFERTYAKNYSRSPAGIERIGKKYQWIAFHELLARMSDNLHWINRGYTDVDDSKFWGPWQIYKRDLDPTVWIRETGDSGWDESENSFWWQPYIFPFVEDDIDKQKSWLKDEKIVPNFKEILERTSPYDNKNWIVLRGFSQWIKEPKKNKNVIPTQDAWFRINSCFIHKKDVSKLKETIIGKNLCDPHILTPNSTGHQGFLKEYPWHPVYEEMSDWIDANEDKHFQEFISVRHLVPINQYNWEIGSGDKSLNQTISLYLPSKHLVNEFNLSLAPFEYGLWLGIDNSPVFIDPSAHEKGPSYALMQSEQLKTWLEANDLQLVWLVGGEKQLYTNLVSKFYGRLIYSGYYTFSKDTIDGEIWFIDESGSEED